MINPALLICCVLAVLLSSCDGKRKTLVEIGNEKQILHVGNFDEPQDVDPQITTGMPEVHLQMAIFEGLVSKDPKTLQPIPAVSDYWSASADGRTYRFHIRQNAKWSDGQPVTAYDFEYAWHRAITPELAADYATDFFILKNAEAYFKGEVSDIKQVGIRAIDEENFEFELTDPIPFILSKLDHHPFMPVPKHVLEKFGAFSSRTSGWTKPKNIVSNGAFKVKEWIPGVVFSVVPNPFYWDAAVVKLKEIRFYPVNSLQQEERMFRTGLLHKTEFMPTGKIEYYKGRPEYINYPYYGTYFYSFNTRVKPLDNYKVRRALSYAVDRDSLVNNVLKGGQIPAYHYTPDSTWGFTSLYNMRFDVAYARQLLAEAGFPDGKGFPEFTILYNTNSDHMKVAVAIQQMWKKYLGINVKLRNMEWKVYLNERDLGNFDILRRGNIGDVLDPTTFLDTLRTGDPFNDGAWSNSAYDATMEKAKTKASNEERFSLFQEAEKIIVDEAPILPIYFYTTNNLVLPSVKGYYNNIMDYHPYKYVYLDGSNTKVER